MAVQKWNDQAVLEAVARVTERNMARAVQYAVGVVKVDINRGNPTGTNPSAPGEAPKKVTARLFASITGDVVRRGNKVIGRYGSNVPYAKFLELGVHGTTSTGGTRVLAARPFLRPVLIKKRATLLRLISGRR